MRKILVFVFLFALLVPSVGGQVLEEERLDAFMAIRGAEEAGADVSGLVFAYDHALALIATGDSVNVTIADEILAGIISSAATLEAEAVRQGNIEAVVAIVKTLVLVGAAVVVWIRGDEWFWRLWRRTRKGYVVE